jgi:tail protein
MPVLVPSPPVPSPDWPATYPSWQLEIGGLVLGSGTSYQIDADGPAGLGLPDLRTSDLPRPQDHGVFFGADFFSSRTVTIDIWLLAGIPADATDLMDALIAVWQPPAGSDTYAPLTVRLPGQDDRVLYGRPRRLAYDTSRLRSGAVKGTLQYEAADPRLYSATGGLATVNLPTVTGGLEWPTGWPLIWGTGTAGGVTITNDGNFGARPVVTFHGDLLGLTLENVTAGKAFHMNDSYLLGAGETLVVDFDARTVLLDGTASRYGDVDSTSQWWELQPGPNSIRLAAHSGTGWAEINHRSAWL